MIATRVDVTLVIEGPFHSGSGRSTDWIDKLTVRKSSSGAALIPDTEFAGRLYHLAAALGYELDVLVHLFGYGRSSGAEADSHGGRRGAGAPTRGALLFEDLVETDGRTNETSIGFLQHRRDLDDQVVPGDMYVVESPLRTGEQARFSGAIRFLSEDLVVAERVVAAVDALIRGLDQIGGFWHTDWGSIVDSSAVVTHDRLRVPEFAADCKSLELILRPSKALCLTGLQVSLRNLFVSEDNVRGSTIKATIASMLRVALAGSVRRAVRERAALDLLESNLWRIVFLDARPRQANPGFPRPSVLPSSLATVKEAGQARTLIVDCALIDQPPTGFLDLRFAVDWKSHVRASVEARFSDSVKSMTVPVRPIRSLRTHTAIDYSSRSAAESQLFAHEVVEPDDERYFWHARVLLHEVPAQERGTVAAALQALFRLGLHGVGKTKAWVAAEIKSDQSSGTPTPTSPIQVREGEAWWVLTLQSEALMLLPEDLRSNSADQAYGRAIEELSRSGSEAAPLLRLIRQFASESLVGGTHLVEYHRWPKREPQVITRRGSVFVVTPADGANADEALALVHHWCSYGLPIRKSTVEYFKLSLSEQQEWWKVLPFLPANGYGELAALHTLHSSYEIPQRLDI
jgi:hypothetical protein